MSTTLTILLQVEQYLTARRAMGFDLRGEGYQLRAFARFAQQQGSAGVLTTDFAVRWARSSTKPGPVTAARRLEVLRPFLKYCRQFDAAIEVVPAALCGRAHRRVTPHIYTEAEIANLLQAAKNLSPTDGLRPLTYVTLFGLIAATGLRLSEALQLKQADVDSARAILVIRETKFKKSRMVPLHPSTAQALKMYQQATLVMPRSPGVETLFLTASGNSLPKRSVHNTFEDLRRGLGWIARGGHPHPRIHDLRHTFICRALLRGQQNRQIDHVVDAISTYVGHSKVSDTYWYLSATPELMNHASERFACFTERGAR
jgi:integrase